MYRRGAGAFEPNSRGASLRRGEQRLCVQNSLSVFVFCILAALLAPAGAQAQALLGEINGTVVDATQAAIVGARVVATNPDTNFSRQTTTNFVGGYTLADLPPAAPLAPV